jgi:hypothetical protein
MLFTKNEHQDDMCTTKTLCHFTGSDGTPQTIESTTHHFSQGSEELTNNVCLVNTCCDYTGFEEVPAEIDEWLNRVSMDHHHFPNLTRLWGGTRSVYAFTVRYEIGNERDSESHREDPIILPYDEQLSQLMKAAGEITKAIPYALVSLSEMSGCQEVHELELVFPYPCEPEKITTAMDILNKRFEYVWKIGSQAGDAS